MASSTPQFNANSPQTKYINNVDSPLTLAVQVDGSVVSIWDLGTKPPALTAQAKYSIVNDDIMVPKPADINYSAKDQLDGKPVPKYPAGTTPLGNIYASVHVPFIECKQAYQKKYISALLWYHISVLADANYDAQLQQWKTAQVPAGKLRSPEPPLGAIVVELPNSKEGMIKYWDSVGFNFAATQMTLAGILAQSTDDQWIAPFNDATVAKMAAFWDAQDADPVPGKLSFKKLNVGEIYGALDRVEVLALAGIKKGKWFRLANDGKTEVKATKNCIIS